MLYSQKYLLQTPAQLPSVIVGCTLQLPRIVTWLLPAPCKLVRLVLAVELAACPPELGCQVHGSRVI